MIGSFQWGVHCEFLIESYGRAILSVPALSQGVSLGEKDLLFQEESSEGKATLEEHLWFLNDQKTIRRDAPLLVFGVRNNLVNFRAPIIFHDRAYAVEGECPSESVRPYYGIGSRDGKLSVGQALGGSSDLWQDFFVAGIPVLWDNSDEEGLLNAILVEAADHSHVFRLPRGHHPDASETTRGAWSQLHDVFKANIHSDSQTAVLAMRSALTMITPPLLRCDDYLNGVVGIRDDGVIVCIYAHARLESLGLRAKMLGCRRAICVENSGSVMPTFLPAGLDGDQIPLLRAPNFRSHGRAVLVLELNNPFFSSYPVLKYDR